MDEWGQADNPRRTHCSSRPGPRWWLLGLHGPLTRPRLLSGSFGGKGGSRMKVKLLWKNAPVGNGDKNARAFEEEINAWLSEHPCIKIVDIKQSSSGGS